MDIQELYNRIQQKKKKKKELTKVVKEALDDPKYQEKKENILALRQSLKTMELTLKAEYTSEIEQIEKLDDDIKSDIEMLSDMALNEILENKEIELTDEYDNIYLPILKVLFKKK